ncbi:lipoprotein LpqB [Gordonia spumicola]|uniref:Lipoprotein LpqB n=1 Tax=Gordonia spumicola TaxID=589161 RepID=A0A7I9VF86_9ACTN|nr:LpqB family beta-propeller domain-containing protein [Gordonia spumicola]GEE03997.1 lipoprotein LpqB [Gordonia spumicola]
MSARRTLAALLLVMTTTLTGCVSIPDDSAPQPIEAFSRKDPLNAVPAPRRSDDPETLARNFIRAMADPTGGHKAARRYLTGSASSRWDDQGDLTVVDDVSVVVDERTETAIRLRITGDHVGTLSPAGQLLPASGSVVIPLSMSKTPSGWRIDGDLPRGVVTDNAQFLTAYRRADLYFPDRTMKRLVTDPRWLYGAAPDASALVTLLMRGPSPDLSGAIGAGADKGATLTAPVSTDSDTITVELGNVTDTDTGNRTVLAAQIVWTLDAAGLSGTYRINADGAPLVADQDGGWRTADVRAFEPDAEQTTQPVLHLVRGGAVVRSTGQRYVAIPGPLGAGRDVRSAAVTRDLGRVAAVVQRGDRQALVEGPYGGDPVEVASGRTVSSPSFGADDTTGYAIVDDRPIQWSRDQQGRARAGALDVTAVQAVRAGPITAMSIAPDGVRVALVVAGRPLLAVISTNARGVPALTGVRDAAPADGTALTDLAWATSDVLYVIGEGDESPVLRISIAGGPSSPLVGGNLKPPLQAIAASPRSVYVTDSQGVLQLGIDSTRPDQYWTSVGTSIPPGSVPVVPEG